MLPASKVSVVQVARRRLGLTEADYRAILTTYGGADSAKALTQRGFEAVMERFEQLGFVSRRKAAATGLGRPGMASTGQLELIRSLWAELHVQPNDRGLDRWLDRHFGVSALRFLPSGKAHAVIGALRAWSSRQDLAG